MAEPGDPGEPLRREHVGEADRQAGFLCPSLLVTADCAYRRTPPA